MEWEECLGIPKARHILSPLYDPGTPGAALDLDITEVDKQFLTQLEKFIDEL
jgi:hypothetical protein